MSEHEEAAARVDAPAEKPPAGSGDAGAGGRRPRRVRVGLAASVVVGVALLLWGADWLARWGAEALLARNIQSATGVTERPTVTVHGMFFLPQVVRGRYDDVEVTVRGLSSGPLRIEQVHAHVRGVHLTFHDVLMQNAVPVYIEHSTEDASLTYADLDRYLAATGRPLTIAGAPNGEVELTGTIRVLGHRVSASARSRLAFRDGALAVRPTQIDTGTALDRVSRLLLGQRFTFDVPLDPLPFGQHPTAVHAGGSGLRVRVQGSDVVVRP